MPIDTISDTYPDIHRHHESVGGPWGRMEQLYEDGNMSLPALDAALRTVGMGHGATLQGLAANLFSDDLGKVLAAICEYLAFGWLSAHAGLAQADVGYPANWAGEDPPVEGVLRAHQSEVAFDVKDGSGSGLSLLQDLLQRQVNAQAGPPQEPPRVHVALNAPTGQRWVNENFNGIVAPFRQELRTNGLGARRLRYDAGSGVTSAAKTVSPRGQQGLCSHSFIAMRNTSPARNVAIDSAGPPHAFDDDRARRRPANKALQRAGLAARC